MRNRYCFSWLPVTFLAGAVGIISCNSADMPKAENKNIAVVKDFFELMHLKKIDDWTNLPGPLLPPIQIENNNYANT